MSLYDPKEYEKKQIEASDIDAEKQFEDEAIEIDGEPVNLDDIPF